METQFYWGMFTMLAVQGLGYFIWTRIQAAKASQREPRGVHTAQRFRI